MRAVSALVPVLVVTLNAATMSAQSEDRAAVAERFFRAVYTGDAATVTELAAEDVVISYPVFDELFGSHSIRGREAVASFSRRFSSRWLEPEITVHEVVSDGDVVVLLWSFEAIRADQDDRSGQAVGSAAGWGGISLLRFDENDKIVQEVGEESTPGPYRRLVGSDGGS